MNKKSRRKNKTEVIGLQFKIIYLNLWFQQNESKISIRRIYKITKLQQTILCRKRTIQFDHYRVEGLSQKLYKR